MAERFFYEQIVNIMCCPIFAYDEKGKLLDKIGSADKEWWLWLGYDRKKAESILSEKKDIRSYIPEIRDILRQFFMIKRTGQLWQQDL